MLSMQLPELVLSFHYVAQDLEAWDLSVAIQDMSSNLLRASALSTTLDWELRVSRSMN